MGPLSLRNIENIVKVFPHLQELWVDDHSGLIKLFNPRLLRPGTLTLFVDKVGFSLDYRDVTSLSQLVSATQLEFCRLEDQNNNVAFNGIFYESLKHFNKQITKITFETDSHTDVRISKKIIEPFCPFANLDYVAI